jgi:hypothetical protein
MRAFKAWLILTAILFVIAAALILGAGTVVIAWLRSRPLNNRPDKESAFFAKYTPEHVIQPFLCNQSFGRGGEPGGGSDKRSVNHEALFFWTFAMRSDKELALMTELNDDAYHQLILNGARGLSRNGSPQTGFRYDYALGNTTGTVTIPPIQPGPTHRATSLPSGMVDVLAKVDLKEQWSPEQPVPTANNLVR